MLGGDSAGIQTQGRGTPKPSQLASGKNFQDCKRKKPDSSSSVLGADACDGKNGHFAEVCWCLLHALHDAAWVGTTDPSRSHWLCRSVSLHLSNGVCGIFLLSPLCCRKREVREPQAPAPVLQVTQPPPLPGSPSQQTRLKPWRPLLMPRVLPVQHHVFARSWVQQTDGGTPHVWLGGGAVLNGLPMQRSMARMWPEQGWGATTVQPVWGLAGSITRRHCAGKSPTAFPKGGSRHPASRLLPHPL